MPIRELLDDVACAVRLEDAIRSGVLPIERLLAPVGRTASPLCDTGSLLRELGPELPGLLLPGGPEVLSLGTAALPDATTTPSACAVVDLVLLQALRQGGRRPRYRAVSPSVAVLAEACRTLEAASPPFTFEGGVRADLGDPLHWDALKPLPGGTSRLVLVLGGMLGRGEPEVLVSELRRLLRRGDHLLVDSLDAAEGDLDATLHESELRDAACAALATLGIPPERVDLAVDPDASDSPRSPGITARRAVLTLRPGPELSIGGARIPDSVPLTVARDTRFTAAALRTLLADVGAFDVVRTRARGAYTLVLARPSA